MMKFKKGRKRAIIGSVAAVLLGATAAFAFFTSTGSGAGSAGTATATQALKIQQIGAGYNSLITSNASDPYIQDQTYSGAGISQFGNNVTLAKAGAQQLINVVVAFRNWNTAVSGVPITLSIDNTVAGPISDVETPTIPAAIVPGANPSLTNVTFNFASQGAFVDQQFTYLISFDASGAAGSLNVALSSSTNNLSVGSDTNPGQVTVNTTDPNLGNDFPGCATPVATGTPVAVNADCGPEAPGNPGAYGNEPNNADIPAVQVNVVGGVVTGLYPGGPAQPVNFAITNPNSSSVQVNQVTTTAGVLSNTSATYPAPPNPACDPTWYPIGTPTVTVGESIPQGTSIFDATGTSISMTETNSNQDNCEGADIGLNFTSN
jgi:hypothetical protein